MITEEDLAFCTWFLCSPCALDDVVYLVFHGLLWSPFFTSDSSLFVFVLLETDHYFEVGGGVKFLPSPQKNFCTLTTAGNKIPTRGAMGKISSVCNDPGPDFDVKAILAQAISHQ